MIVSVLACGPEPESDSSSAQTPDEGEAAQPSFSFARASLQLPEGATQVVKIQLSEAATEELSLTARSLDPYRVSVPGALIFKPGELQAGLQLQSIPDEDTKDNTVTVEVGSGSSWQRLSVQIVDRGQLSFSVSPAQPRLTEGEELSLSVALSRAPSDATELAISVSDERRLSISTSTLSFTPENYAAPQTVRLSALEDDDANLDEVQLRLVADGLAPVLVSVQIEDKDDQGFVVTALVDTEEGVEQPLSFGLGYAPSEPTRVRFVGTPGILVTPSELTLSPTDYAPKLRAQVMVSADDNLVDTDAELLILSSAVSTERKLSFTARDPDQQQVLVDGAASGEVQVVQGVPDTLNVSLRYQPAAEVSVQLGARTTAAVGDESAAQTVFMPTELSFSPANWDQPQEVRVYPAADGSVELSVNTDDPDSLETRVRVQVVESAEGSQLSLLSSQVSLHPGQEYQLPISLSPARDLLLPIINSNSDCVRAPAELEFSTADSAPRIQLSSRSADCSATLSFGSEFAARIEVRVTAGATDAPRILAPPQLQVDEGGQASLTVQLSAAPSAPVQLVVKAPEQLQAIPQQLSISDAAEHEISLTAMLDPDTLDEELELQLSAQGYLSTTVSARVADQDGQGIELSPALITVDEGFSAEQSVRLAKRPEAAVTVQVDAPEGVRAEPASLSFTPDNYSVAQSVLLSAGAVEDNRRFELVYSGGGAFKAATLTVEDASSPRLLISRRQLSLGEGAQAELQLQLSAGSPVEVRIQNSAPAALSLSEPGPISVGTSPVGLTLTALQDEDLADGAATLSFSSSAGDAQLEVEVVDDDLSSLALSEVDDLSMSEDGAAQTVSVALNAVPPQPVLVRVLASGSGATVAPASFTLSDTTPQQLSVTPVEDADTEDGVLSVRLRADGLSPVGFSVTVSDPDEQALQVLLTDDQATEGSLSDQGALTVALAAPPAAEAVVQLSLEPETAPATLSATELRFDSTSWDQPQAVYVTATEDSDELDGSVQVRATLGALSLTTAAITLKEPSALPALVGRTTADTSERLSDGWYYLETTKRTGQWNAGMACLNLSERPEGILNFDLRLEIVEGSCREGLEIDDGVVSLTRANYNTATEGELSNCVSIDCDSYGELTVKATARPYGAGDSSESFSFYLTSREQSTADIKTLSLQRNVILGAPKSLSMDYVWSNGRAYPIQEGGPVQEYSFSSSNKAEQMSCELLSPGALQLSCGAYNQPWSEYGSNCEIPAASGYLRVRAVDDDTAAPVRDASLRCLGVNDTQSYSFEPRTLRLKILDDEQETQHWVAPWRASAPAAPGTAPYRALAYIPMAMDDDKGKLSFVYQAEGALKEVSLSLGALLEGGFSGQAEDDVQACAGGWDSLQLRWSSSSNSNLRPYANIFADCGGTQYFGWLNNPTSKYSFSSDTAVAVAVGPMSFVINDGSLRVRKSAYSSYKRKLNSGEKTGYDGATNLQVAENPITGRGIMAMVEKDGVLQCGYYWDSFTYLKYDVELSSSYVQGLALNYRLASVPGERALILTQEAGSEALKLYTIGYDCSGLKEIGSWTPPAGSQLQAGTYSVAGNGEQALVLATVVDTASGASTLVALTTSMNKDSSQVLTQTALASGGSRGSAVWAFDRWIVSYFTGAGEDGRMHVLAGSLKTIPAALTAP